MRKEKSIKNFLTSFIPYVILLVLGFFRVDVFIGKLGDEIYALNQLFYQLFIYMSLAEAGAGAFIVQLYYKCFADKNYKKIINIYHAARKLLLRISLIILLAGFVISFSLKLLTNNNLSLLYMQIVFILFIFKNITEYLMMAPKSLIEADQKLYKINIRYYGMKIAEIIVDIILLQLGFNYIIILIAEIIIKFLTYYITNKKIYKEYKWLQGSKADKSVKIVGVSNMLWHRISEAIHYNTDIIISSSFLTPLVVIIYSSYNYITKYLTDITDIISGSMSASFGNVVYKENKDSIIKIFEELNIMFLFFASFLSIMVYSLSSYFVALWLGEKYLMSDIALILLVTNFFIVISRKPLNMYRNINGLFKETKIIVLLEAFINLFFSIILVKYYSLSGILFSTTLSMITTTFWYMPYFIYKRELGIKCYNYFIRFAFVVIITIILIYLLKYFSGLFQITSIINWILIAILYGSITFVVLYVIFYFFSKNFRSLSSKVLGMVIKKKN